MLISRQLCNLPEGFHTIGETKNSEYAAIAHKSEPVYGLQFHPEVTRKCLFLFFLLYDLVLCLPLCLV